MSTTKALSAVFLIVIALGAIGGIIGMLFAPVAAEVTTQATVIDEPVAALEPEEPVENDEHVNTDYVTWVITPAQDAAETPERFVVPDPEPYVLPEGENIAYRKPIVASSYTDVYPGKNAVDGRDRTYWEGSEFPSVYTIDLGEVTEFKTLVLQLPPLRTWGKRTQAFSVQISDDGEAYTELTPSADYVFDGKLGNAIQLDYEAAAARYVRVEITANSGATGGQMSEFSIFQ